MKKKTVKISAKKSPTKKAVKPLPTKTKKPLTKKIVKASSKKSSQKTSTLEKQSKRKPVSIRILTSDIEAIKVKAAKLGVPYQTYINKLNHRDAVNE